jgi:subtilisin family serine protease
MMLHRLSHMVLASMALCLSSAGIAQDDAPTSAIPLPSKHQEEFLKAAGASITRGPGPTISSSVNVKSLPPDSRYFVLTQGDKSVRQPLQSANELIILLNPKLQGPEIQKAITDNRLDLIQTLPQIGAIVVDASRRLNGKIAETASTSVAKAKASALGQLVEALSKDERFISVTPNAVISSFQLRSAVEPAPPPPIIGAASEQSDWGVADIHADQFWGKMTTPIKIGVVDVGFAQHEDIDAEKALPGALQSNDHGNHVAGIMCAKHNGIGVRGVLKNCTVVESSGALMLVGGAGVEGSGTSPFVAQFSEYLATVLEFIDQRPDIRVINLSLGYNWMPNFNIDPRVPGADNVRNDVRGQGRIFATVLASAKRKSIAIVMAAGNDSSTLAKPLEAEWASPFAFGSRLIEKADGWSNGVIVEAYGSDHHRPGFSNVGGNVACPGVDVTSALASSPKAYGLMSGTSMASPYCAAGLAAIRWLRPELSLRDAIGCMMSGPDKIDDRIPRLNLAYAITQCKIAKR